MDGKVRHQVCRAKATIDLALRRRAFAHHEPGVCFNPRLSFSKESKNSAGVRETPSLLRDFLYAKGCSNPWLVMRELLRRNATAH